MEKSVRKIETSLDLEKAFDIRKRVFVDGQGVPAEEEYDEYDKTSNHYMVFLNGIEVGTARWRFTDNGVKLERFAILNEFRNNGLGELLLKKVLEDIPTPNYLYLHAQLPAVNLYKRGGFNEVGDSFMECDIEHYKMEMNV